MFNTKIPFYSIAILLSLIANLIIVSRLSKKYSFTSREIICLLLYENVGIVCGAKVLTFLQNYKELNGQFDFLSLGLSSYGAVIGALLFFILFSLQFKKSFKEILYIFMPSLPLMYGIGKIGCFLIGCCYGIEYSGFGSVVYHYNTLVPIDTPLFPVQIVETAFFAGIFIYMMVQHERRKFHLGSVGVSFILCGFAKFILEFLRYSPAGKQLSSTQVISIAFIIIGTFTTYLFTRESDKNNPHL